MVSFFVFIRAVHLTKGTECKFCGKSYKKIQQHISDIHCDLEFKCDMCSKLFASSRLLKRHIEMYHLRDENVVTTSMARCEVCRIGLDYRKRVQHIELSHLLPPEFNVPCPVCKISVKFLPFHLNKCHKKINIKRDLFPCRKCRRYFLTMSELKAHDTNHVSYSCQICRLVFHEFLQLGWHLMQTHHKVFNLGVRNRSKRAGIQEDLNNLKLFDFDPNEPDSDDVDDEIQDEVNAVEDEDDAEEGLKQENRKDISEIKTFSVFVNGMKGFLKYYDENYYLLVQTCSHGSKFLKIHLSSILFDFLFSGLNHLLSNRCVKSFSSSKYFRFKYYANYANFRGRNCDRNNSIYD